ncbi:MAG: DinB family protein [Balneolales bacterium]|nr:DinB family protein [Balneolales bacterium]
MISPKNMFLIEYEKEAEITRKMLMQIPDDVFGWKPHEKSMSVKQLGNHIAEMGSWMADILASEKMDFAEDPYIPNDASNGEDLMQFFEESLIKGREALEKTDQKVYEDQWMLCQGDMIFQKGPKWEFIRHVFNQITHHRAQMGVYLRLLDIKVPGSYGGSADDNSF